MIMILFMKLRLIKDVSQIATMKALGLTNKKVRRQYLYKISIISILGVVTGTVVSKLLGEKIISIGFSLAGLGLSRLTFIVNPWVSYLLIPVLLTVMAMSTG